MAQNSECGEYQAVNGEAVEKMKAEPRVLKDFV